MRFHGGPYDGRDLPIEPPFTKLMRLPPEEDLPAFLDSSKADPGGTGLHEWPYLYELDENAQPPVYRFQSQ